MQTVCVDIGYGYTKGLAQGKSPFICPSLVSPARDIRYTGGLGSGNGITVTVDGSRYFVGDKAELQGRGSGQTLNANRTGTEEQIALFYAACSELVMVATREVVVVTGLPVADFDKANKAKLKHALRGHHLVERDGRTPREFDVVKVVIVPQAVGCLYGMVLDDAGRVTQNEHLQLGRVGVIDVGQLTTNFVTLDELRYVDRLSESRDVGVSRMLVDVQRDIYEWHDLNLDKLNQVDRVVRDGYVYVMGEPVFIDDLIEPHRRVLEDMILTQARSLWGNAADLTAVVLTGGGAPLLEGRMSQVYPHLLVDKLGQFGNVTGYMRLALFQARG